MSEVLQDSPLTTRPPGTTLPRHPPVPPGEVVGMAGRWLATLRLQCMRMADPLANGLLPPGGQDNHLPLREGRETPLDQRQASRVVSGPPLDNEGDHPPGSLTGREQEESVRSVAGPVSTGGPTVEDFSPWTEPACWTLWSPGLPPLALPEPADGLPAQDPAMDNTRPRLKQPEPRNVSGASAIYHTNLRVAAGLYAVAINPARSGHRMVRVSVPVGAGSILKKYAPGKECLPLGSPDPGPQLPPLSPPATNSMRN